MTFVSMWSIVCAGEQLVEADMANKDRLLDFAQFVRKRNNFHLHFVDGRGVLPSIGNIYRGQPAYKVCAETHPRFVQLADELKRMSDTESNQYLEKLYQAYNFMHPYAETDWDMFR